MARTLNENYTRNINILKENMKRGMSPSQATQVIDSWREQFVKYDKFGKEEKKFINDALKVVEEKTHLGVKFM